MTKALTTALLALALASPLGACADDQSSLDGSVSEFYPLDFHAVRARLYSSELAIEFIRSDGEAVVRVTVRRAENDPAGPGDIDLGSFGDVTGSADGADLPPFAGGKLALDTYKPTAGARVSGSFEARLESGDITLTLHGTFDAHLDLVENL